MTAQSTSPCITEADCQPILEELMKREPIFHRRKYGAAREALEEMTTPSFWEIGASGRRYGREDIIKTLLERCASQPFDEWETTDFCCQKIAIDTYLLTYTLKQKIRITRRATIWRLENEIWKIVYHQGTIVEEVS